MPTGGSKVGVYVVRPQVDYPFCTRATKATPFEYQGYSKSTESGYSVIRASALRTSKVHWGALLLTILGTLSFNMQNKFKN
jgi:hypothetical protein